MADYDNYRTSILDRARILDNSSTDVTDSLGFILSANSNDNRNQDKVAGINTGTDYGYIDDSDTAEITGETNIQSDSFEPLKLMGEIDTGSDKLVLPSKLPEFTFQNQITNSQYREVDKFKFGEVTINIASGDKLQFDFSGQGCTPQIVSGELSTTSAFIDRPIRGEEITVEIGTTTIGTLRNAEININRNIEGRNAIGSNQVSPKQITEGKADIGINNFTFDIANDYAWQLVYQGSIDSSTDYGMAFKKDYESINITLPNGQKLSVSGVLFGEVDPDEQDGEDTVRQVTLNGDGLNLEVLNWSNAT